MPKLLTSFLLMTGLAAFLAGPALAQTTPLTTQQTTPAPAPAAPATPAQPTAPTPGQATPSQPDAPVPSSVGEAVTLESKPALVLKGEGNWDDGFETIIKLFATLRQEAAKAGLTPVGRPQVFFTQTDDNGFRCDAMLPLAAAATGASLGQNVTAGVTPGGKVLRFPHAGPYDDIDSVYEAISAYLDDKGLTATGQFLEEYLGDPKDSADPSLEMNIYVFLQ